MASAVVQFEDPGYLEAVYAALFVQLQTAKFAGGVELLSSQRAVEAPDRIPADQQPALVLVNGPMHVEQKEFALAKWTIGAVAVVYLQADGAAVSDQSVLSATQANNIVWGLSRALSATPAYEKQTLGGLVYHCWIEGGVLTEVQQSQVVITIPILILAGTSG